MNEGSQNRNSSRAGIWGQELMQRHGRVLLTGLLLIACSVYFFIEPRTTSQGWHHPQWARPPYEFFNLKNALQLDLTEIPSFQITVAYVMLT